ncbi:MAG: type II toxin-antitoxin system Phd/YefM family antitoxin [Sulfuricurvum sp.]
MNLATDIRPISYLKAKTADVLLQVNESHRPLIITQNGEAKAVIQDIQSFENMKNAITLLKLLAQGDKDVQEGKITEQNVFFNRIESSFS